MKHARLAKVLAMALAVVFFVPTSMSIIRGSNEEAQPSNSSYVRIYVSGSEAHSLATYGVEVVEKYDGFVLAKADSIQVNDMKSRGIDVEDAADVFALNLRAASFDVRYGEPAMPASMRIGSYPAHVKGYYLVHFLGPVKEEWKWDLEARGAEILGYVPNDAFLVRMTPEARNSISTLREVIWSGIYHPAYRIDPSLYDARGLTPVEIITFGGAPVTSVVAFLNQQGYGEATYGLGDAGVVRYYQGSDFGVVKARIDASLIPAVASLHNVEYVEPYYEPTLYNYYAQYVHQTDNGDPFSVDARRIWDMGIRGQGQIVSTADSGIDYDHNMFRQSTTEIVLGGGDIYNVTDYDRRKLIRYLPMSNYTNVDPWTEEWALKDSSVNTGPCTSGHGTATAGILDGNDDPIFSNPSLSSLNDGMAKEAKHFFEDIGTVGPSQRCAGGLDDLLSYIPDDLNLMFGPAYAAGARVHSNSWGGGTSTYALSSRQIDEFMWKHPDMLVTFAEGNDGGMLGNVQSQAAAKNVLSAGGTFNFPSENGMTTYSAWGPTLDGRQKPTVAFVSEGATSWSDANPWSNVFTDMEWSTFGGTSYAAPDGAGQATLMRQYFTDGWYPTGDPLSANSFNPQASLTMAMLAASGVKMTGARTNPGAENRFPNDAQGWGRPLLDDAMYFNGDNRKLSVHDDRGGLATGEWEEYKYNVNDGSQILKFIVAWTDYPGSVGAGKALVNDLDIQVTSPTGDVYKGNVWQIFSQGQSRPNFGSFDHLNNIEGVIVNTPATGVWTLRVMAYDVPSGPQPYSIVVVGGLDIGYGQVFLDRHSYMEDDTILITVVDSNAVGSVAVNVTSTTEPWDEMITLIETGVDTGVFTGSINTSFGTPLPNGIIEVSDRDTVWVNYSDLNPVHSEYAHAVIHAIRPTIYNVHVSGITSSTATITWLTNIPADSYVYYDMTPPPLTTRFAPELKIAHSITLVNLQTATLYYFDVASTDGRGHRTLDTNGGNHYSFKTTAKGEILLVLGDETYEQNRPEGLQAYRRSLADKGWAYNEWHVAYSGDPLLTLMQSYKVVIWQVGLEQYPPHTDAELQLLNDYLDGGGRLFYVHHDTFWAYCAITSSWYDLGRCFWVEGILKATFNSGNPNAGDPMTLTTIVGEGGDPISDIYATGAIPGPIPLVPFRNGGAADEVTSVSAGGAVSYVWSDAGGDATPDKISVKWVSSAPNGTLGVGVWGGYNSKMVGLYANWIDINYIAGVTLDWKRTDILDKTIIWLLDRDHPDVTISAPNGGEVFTTNSITIFWNKSTFGTNVYGQSVYYSPDAGQSWFPIVWDLPPADISYVWSVVGVCNANNYLVRVEVQDDGAPMFNASDDSDAVFSIQRVGGDCGGPLVWAGSDYVQPNPVMGPVTVYINATVDDRTRGNSNIHTTAPAEFFFDATGADGTGWAMNITHAPPTSPVENVVWTGQLDSLPHSCHVLFVHGQDVLGKWGPFENVTFCVQDVPPIRAPRAATGLNAHLQNSGNDVNITWSPSPDDPANLDNYEVWRSINIYDKLKGPSYTLLGSTLPGTLYYVDNGVGLDVNTYFYFVKAVNTGGSSSTVDQVAKFARDLTAAEHLVSVPVLAMDMSVSSVFQTLSFDSLRWYDPTDAIDPWKSYVPGRLVNDFDTVTTGMGLWVHVTSPGVFAVAGKVPVRTTIALQAGWNLVGFPCFMPYTLADLKASMPGNVRAFEAYDSAMAPYYLRKVTYDTFALQAGSGYWIWVGSSASWVLNN